MNKIQAAIQAFVASLNVWRGFLLTAVTGLAAVIAWVISQMGSLSEPVEKYNRMAAEARTERARYEKEFEGDPTQTDLMNSTVYRVRMGIISPTLGANLLCWMAARAQARAVKDRDYLVTADKIVAFIDENHEDFPLERTSWDAIPPFRHSRVVKANDYCHAYLFSASSAPSQQVSTVVLTPETTVSVASSEGIQAGVQPAAPPVVPVRLFPQIALESQRSGVRAAMIDLSKRVPGLSPQGVEVIGTYLGPNQVRFYKQADRARATEIAEALTCDGRPPEILMVVGYEDKPLVKPGSIELWLSPTSNGCRVAPPLPVRAG